MDKSFSVKALSLFLFGIFVSALFVTGASAFNLSNEGSIDPTLLYAVNGGAPCGHDNVDINATVEYVYNDADTHDVYTVFTYECEICGTYARQAYEGQYSHNYTQYGATCNGQRQTITYFCPDCGGTKNELVTCPGAPHEPGQCRWLPV